MDPNAIQQAQQQQQPSTPDPEQVLQANNAALLKKRQAATQQEANSFPQSAISQAMAQVAPNSKDPQVKVGGALNTQNYSGLCLQYVDDQQGNANRQSTAYADYQKNAQMGNIKTTGIPPKGARVYFAPTKDNPAGHVGLSNGDSTFTGATTNDGIKSFGISDWEKYADQQYIGYSTNTK
ncbi:MAG: hypothetical protein ACYC6W_11760 [Nitrosotalea sp.]